MHTLCLYDLTSGATAAAVLTDMLAVIGDPLTINNNHFILGQDAKLMLAYVFGQVDITDAQLQTPLLRTVAIPKLTPLDIVTAPSSRTPVINYKKNPLLLKAGEENTIQISAGTFTIGNTYYAALWIGDGNYAIPMGQVYTVGFTASVAVALNTWANGPITLTNPLPSGTYVIVGMSVYGANLAFARLWIPGQVWRPGVIAGKVAGFIPPPCFRFGEMGVWGQFVQTSPPSLDVFGTGTTTTQTGQMDLIKVS